MSDQQLRDESITLFLAGHETTAIALSWTLWLLSQHPEIEARLAQELAALKGAPPQAADLPRLRNAGTMNSSAGCRASLTCPSAADRAPASATASR